MNKKTRVAARKHKKAQERRKRKTAEMKKKGKSGG